jgi:methyltransferase
VTTVPTPTALLHAWLALLVLERLAELALSRRNVRASLAAGGWEEGRRHYPLLVLFHAGFLAACFAEPLLWPRAWPLAASLAALGGAVLAQALRWWAVASLGARWSTRIVVRPGLPLVRRGPYRWLSHPNYLAVALEVLAVPLIGGAVVTAALGSALNGALLAIRIRAEERALGGALAAGPAPGGRP